MTEAFRETAAALVALLSPYGDRLDVVAESSWGYYLQTKKPSHKKQPLMFAAVRVGKAYVSYHLMPIYMNEPLKATISPALRKRMQGKACFNFKEMPDAALLEELRTLTDAGFRSFEAAGYIENVAAPMKPSSCKTGTFELTSTSSDHASSSP